MTELGADPGIWYTAICHGCEPVLTQPFATARERAHWVVAHREGTGHLVTVHDVPKQVRS